MDTTLFNDLTTGCFEKRLFAYMKAVGLKKISISYSGGGDSGGMDQMDFYPPVNSTVENGIRCDLEEELCSPIYNKHGGFADGGGFHVDGEVTYNLKDHTVHISGTDHHTEYEGEYDEETGEYESEETSEDEWEECLFSKEDMWESYHADSQFVYMYARDFLKGKLPEELHNRLLAEASSNKDDQYAVSYIKEFCEFG